MKYRIKILFLFVISTIIVLLPGCSGETAIPDTHYTYWRERSSGIIETNDVKRLQEIVPFNIVFPEYLPEGLINYSPDLIFDKELEFPSEISVSGNYWATEKRHIIFEEFVELDVSLTGFLEPSPRRAHDILEIKGIKVLEENWLEPVSLGNQEKQTVFIYKWIIDDVYFRLYIYGYSQEEARKVAESMIKWPPSLGGFVLHLVETRKIVTVYSAPVKIPAP